MFTDKVILVTGATSGVGSGVARAFVGEGASVVVSGRNRERGNTLCGELGERALFVAGDISVSSDCDAVVAAAVERFGRLDVLVNGAGMIHVGNAEETSDDAWRQVLSVNLDGAFYMSRAAMPHLLKTRGAIVNIGSDFSHVGGEKTVAYCASKGGMLMMTKAMALDHATQGVRVNIVCPTVIDTPMVDDLARQLGMDAGEQRRIYDVSVPTGRMISVEEVCDAVLFLASDKARHITGASLAVDGGVTAR